jgi:hypothetical protein
MQSKQTFAATESRRSSSIIATTTIIISGGMTPSSGLWRRLVAGRRA